MNIRSLVFVTLALGLISQANAIISGSDGYATDSESGLDWYYLSYKDQLLSYNDVLERVGFGGDLSDWRLATKSEFENLLDNKLSGWWQNSQIDLYYAAYGLVDIFGEIMQVVDNDGTTRHATSGWLMAANSTNVFGTVAYNDGLDGPAYGSGGAYDLTISADIQFLNWGAFLVKETSQESDAVPDSGSTLALLGVSLLGLIDLRRRFSK